MEELSDVINYANDLNHESHQERVYHDINGTEMSIIRTIEKILAFTRED